MINGHALREAATRYENAALKDRAAVLTEARQLLPKQVQRALNIYGLRDGWVVLMPDNVLTSAFGMNVRTGFEVLQALLEGHVILPNAQNSSAFVLTAFGRALVNPEYAAMDGVKDSALDAYVGELQATQSALDEPATPADLARIKGVFTDISHETARRIRQALEEDSDE